jgi:hypothetical protein
MRNRLRRMAVVAVVIATAGTATFTVQAGQSQAISLTFTMQSTSATTATGTWTSAGTLPALQGKSGTVTQTTRITGKGKGKGEKTGQVVHGLKEVTASDGTFVLKFVGAIKPTGATTSEVNGRFVLKKGTGAYAGLHGTGKIHATLDSSSGSITAVYTGKAHVDGA